jgi:hypothetical protein
MKTASAAAIGLCIAAFLPASMPATSMRQTADPAWTTFVTNLESAAIGGRIDEVKKMRLEMLRNLAAAPNDPRVPQLRYTIAYAGMRMAFAPSVPDTEQIAMIEDAMVQLDAVLKTSPNDVEALALVAGLMGARIGKSPELGPTLGPESGQMLGRAARLGPSNPRALLISGQSALNTPPEYGGSASRAEGLFRAALKIFESQPANAPWPFWGRFDAHAWLGQALAARGDRAGARAEYEKALAIAPDSGWVRFSLLPAVK